MGTPAQKKAPRRTQEDRSAESSAAMLQAAVELFAEQGSRVSLMEIGRRSGFSHGLVLARFGSKAELIRTVTKAIQKDFARTVAASAENKKGLAALTATIDAFFRQHESRRIMGRAFVVLLGEAVGPNTEIREVFVAADQAFRDFVARSLNDAKTLREIDDDVPSDAVAVVIVGTLRGIALQLAVGAGGLDMAAVRAQTHAMVRALLTAAPPTGARR
ncbi:MAG: TetR family transcriptional regulator [Alphaproteobacteria bacterium]|nr:TetR family transcriptional regulator [Alphaproteobacteria bacterium]